MHTHSHTCPILQAVTIKKNTSSKVLQISIDMAIKNWHLKDGWLPFATKKSEKK